MDLDHLVGAVLLVVGIASFSVGLWFLLLRRREGRVGSLVATDEPTRVGPTLRSGRYGLVGRPDELRRTRDGRLVPVEIKSRSEPARGPPRSHEVQVWAYCLLVEETTGQPPPFGILRYATGSEFRLPWDGEARRSLLEILSAVREPYDGRATPSPARCSACRWRPGCDARAA